MLPRIDLPRALLRGRFMKAAAAIEWNGIPIDTVTLDLLRQHWTGIQDELIAEIDRDYGVFEGRSFRRERWRAMAGRERHSLADDRERPAQARSDDTFREMAQGPPEGVADARAAQRAVRDAAFRSRGRQRWPQPHDPVGIPIAHRPLPAEQHEIHLRPQRLAARPDQAAGRLGRRLSSTGASRNSASRRCCPAMRRCRPRICRAIPISNSPSRPAPCRPTPPSKPTAPMRELFKQCVLAVAYGMEAKSLAQRIGQPEIVARDLLRAHRETYRKFWAWSDAAVDRAMLLHPLLTVFGWPIRIGSDPNPRSLRNFPCQANGAEMLRLAACFATEQGIEVCALIHDAVLIAAPLDQLDHDIERMQAAMAKASRVVLDGFELRTDVNVVRYPDRYQDPRGAVMWERVMKLVAKREAAKQVVA